MDTAYRASETADSALNIILTLKKNIQPIYLRLDGFGFFFLVKYHSIYNRFNVEIFNISKTVYKNLYLQTLVISSVIFVCL